MISEYNINRLSARCLRVLLCVLEMTQAGERITIEKMIARIGYKSKNAVYPVLVRLRACGLIDFVDNAAATIVPRCRMVIFKEALK